MPVTLQKKDKYEILMKYKSKEQKNIAINKLIDIILSGKLSKKELKEKKEDAVILAEYLLRSSTKTQETPKSKKTPKRRKKTK